MDLHSLSALKKKGIIKKLNSVLKQKQNIKDTNCHVGSERGGQASVTRSLAPPLLVDVLLEKMFTFSLEVGSQESGFLFHFIRIHMKLAFNGKTMCFLFIKSRLYFLNVSLTITFNIFVCKLFPRIYLNIHRV